MVRAMVQGDNFVFSVGGMSDTAGHGNRHSDSYPIVMFSALAPVFKAANIKLEVRNLAMGGVPSFPNSVCMEDAFGADSDVIVWDFRMVERDEVKGELYIRQALMLPRQPSVMFKRELPYLPKLGKSYGELASLHALDETNLFNKVHKNGAQQKEVANDNFCEGQCKCPGQVRWHAGWKMQRLRGLQMAMVYGHMLGQAISEYKALSAQGDPKTAGGHDWSIKTEPLPKVSGWGIHCCDFQHLSSTSCVS